MNPTEHPDQGSLAGALDAIAAGAARAHAQRPTPDGGLAVTDIRAAARRRRTRFEAGVGLAAAAVVGALALGGAALSRADRPAPPVDSPTTTSDVSEPGACGQVLDDLVQPDGGPDVEVSVELTTDEPRVGDPLSAAVVVTDADADPGGGFGHMTIVALARDGVVVGVASGNTELQQSDASTPQRQAELATVTFTGCGADGEPTDALAAGDYDLVAIISNVMLADGEIWAPAFVSNRAPIRLFVSQHAVGLPACGESTGGLVESGGAFAVSSQVQVGTRDGNGIFVHQGFGDWLAFAATITNNGASLSGVSGLHVEFVVAQGGVVVASVGGDQSDPPPDDWPPGEVWSAGMEGEASSCADGDPLPPGEYLLWARLTTSAADAPDGETRPIALIAPPVWFHVYAQDDPDLYGPVTYTSEGEAGWSDVEISAVPSKVALGIDEADVITSVRAFEDGHRWTVEVSCVGSGEEAYPNTRAALVAAGFSVDAEETGPAASSWRSGDFSLGDLTVHVEAEAGGDGWGSRFLVVRAD